MEVYGISAGVGSFVIYSVRDSRSIGRYRGAVLEDSVMASENVGSCKDGCK